MPIKLKSNISSNGGELETCPCLMTQTDLYHLLQGHFFNLIVQDISHIVHQGNLHVCLKQVLKVS